MDKILNLSIWLLLSAVLLAIGCWRDASSASDSAPDLDIDTDADTDSGTDTDADSDTDTESDTGTDADTDTDSDVDTDTDTDTDTDSDTYSDTGSETDTETDSEDDTDTSVDTAGCPHECVSDPLCAEVGGTVHDEYTCILPGDVCCEWVPDTDSCSEVNCEDPCVRFVDVDVTASSDGLSWPTAFTTVQQGIDDAETTDLCCPCQVWVAEGTYSIYQSSPLDTVQLEPNVHIYGGFDGTETEIDQRDWVEHETILDGNDQVHHVVTGSQDATLDGFIITGGHADGISPHNKGGGIYNPIGAEPVIANCVITGNYAFNDGGGIYNFVASPTITDCIFSDNYAEGDGGGMFNLDFSNPIVTHCTFTGNVSDARGGAVGNYESSPSFFNCVFTDSLGSNGATIHNHESSSPYLENCVIANNTMDTGGEGCAMFNNGYCSPTIVNCTIVKNTALGSGTGGIGSTNNSSLTIVNSIVWGNSNEQLDGWDPEIFATYSLIQDGWTGDGNISDAPLFVDYWGDDFHLQPGSPAIDAADGPAAPEFDIEGNSRVDDPDTPNTGLGPPWVDIGAYEYQL